MIDQPGRFRRIQLGDQVLDLDRSDLGHPQGLALWDAAYEAGDRAECLFPGCRAVGAVVLILARRHDTGTRFARHLPGEGGQQHAVRKPGDPIHEGMTDLWRGMLAHAGAQTEHSHKRAGRVVRRDDVYAPSGAVPIDIEVQLSPRKPASAVRRNRDLASFGVTSVWDCGPGVDLRDRVPSLRHTTDIADVLRHRDPRSLTLIGPRSLVPHRAVGGGWRIDPEPKPMRWASIAEQLPAGDLVAVSYRRAELLVAADQAEHYRDILDKRPERVERAPRPRGELRRHQELADFAPRPAVHLDWRDRAHWSNQARPCIAGDGSTNMRNEHGDPEHKGCAERRLS